jgi:hypothetical protein
MPAGVSAYTALANVTLGSSAASVTFSSINQSYRDLVLVINGYASGNNGGDAVNVRFNGDSGNNYNQVRMGGDGSSTFSNSAANQNVSEIGRFFGSISSNTSPVSIIANIMDYSATDKHKTAISRSNAAMTNGLVDATCIRYASTSAITSFVLTVALGSNFVAGSSFALYGVSA